MTTTVLPIDLPRTNDVSPTQYLAVPGGTIAYDVAGSGPTVVCVPSIGDVRAEYRFLRPYLVDAGFTVVTMDLRGHGESSVGFDDYSSQSIGRDVIALARHLNHGPITLIGTSKAGGSAVWVAAEAPELIANLVLISPFVRTHGNDAMMRRMMKVLLARPWGAALWTMYFPNFYPSRKPQDFEAYRRNLKANLQEPGRLQALRAMVESSGDVSDELGQVSAPTLVLMGTKDPDFNNPAEEASWIAEETGGTALTVEGAGHYPHAEMPEQTGPAIVRFLSSLSLSHAA